MFKGFARRRSIPNNTGQEQSINDHVKQEGTGIKQSTKQLID